MTSAARPGRAAPVLRRALLPAAILAAAGSGAVLLQGVFDPFRQDVPLCPLHALTGLDCPGCGATRAVHALLDGDLLLALQNNALLVLAIPLLVVVFARWTLRRIRGREAQAIEPSRALVIGVVALVAVYTIARNLPWFPFLAPTSLIGA
ncbi:DUF2752 domain-containing protein [Brachybacterium hainanense]|uniref:DUF2752 domain-containing protein n=1 Tax=Brachybacterium hainanense TaxID=1541174 RepID=A0ABV6RCW8_9MICO